MRKSQKTMEQQFARVFGSCNTTDDGRIYADGWPDAFAYDAERAVPVLARFADGHGLTESGDAEVCEALESADAVD